MRSGLNELLNALARLERGQDRPDPALIARALHAVLHNQLRIIEILTESGAGMEAEEEAPYAPASAPTPSAARPAPPAQKVGEPASAGPTPSPAVAAQAEQTPAAEAPAAGSPRAGAVVAGGAAAESPEAAGDPEAQESHRRCALERFPLEDLNRWLSSGTVFQIREDFAYLNLGAMGGQVATFRQNIRSMGFTSELGVLIGEEVGGRVLLFRKP
jgi:hypothetical protein